MTVRMAALIIGALDAAAWLLICAGTFWSQSDPATKGLDNAAGYVVTALFLLTGAPALWLAWRQRVPRPALVLAIGFPAAFAALFVVAVVVFA
jgi:hypothetical protein